MNQPEAVETTSDIRDTPSLRSMAEALPIALAFPDRTGLPQHKLRKMVALALDAARAEERERCAREASQWQGLKGARIADKIRAMSTEKIGESEERTSE